MECSRCGVYRSDLADIISSKGIVKVCKDCLSGDNVQFKKPTESEIQGINKTESLYQRLSNSAGLDAEEHKKNVFGNEKKDLIEQEASLRNLVEKNAEENGPEVFIKKRNDLIENFHWIIMRARRAKKLSISQLARDIGEAEMVLKKAEQGILPEGNYNVAIKLEKVLGINILGKEVLEKIQTKKRQLGFDDLTSKEITLSELQTMKSDFPQKKKIPYWKKFVFGRKKDKIDEKEYEEVGKAEEIPEVEFDNTSLEISTTIIQEESPPVDTNVSQEIPEEISVEEKAEKKVEEDKLDSSESLNNKKDLNSEEINDLIFGKK